MGGGGLMTKTSVTTQDGTVLDLTGNPLTYGAPDATLTGVQRTMIEAQEKKRETAKIEYCASYDENGNIIGREYKGSKGSVRHPYYTIDNDKATFTHNHPRGTGQEGVLGGTFSEADIKNFANNKIRTYRASAAEGTYSISKTASFDRHNFKAYYRSVDRQATRTMDATVKSLKADFRAGKINARTCNQGIRDAFNKSLVDLHNGLLAGQKQYGYTYTLEART